MITANQIDGWLGGNEDEHIEFKEARTSFSFEKVVKYCAALANEGGGRLVLGATDKHPRRVVGSTAYSNIAKPKHDLLQRVRLRVEVDEVAHPDGRVVVFTAPPRPVGVPIEVNGRYLMRAGDSLTGMTPDMLQTIFAESAPDFTAQVCPNAVLADLDPAAIDAFRQSWARKTRNKSILTRDTEQLLEDAELLVNGDVTYAALILLAKSRSLGRLLPHAELVYEYRATDASGPAQDRIDLRAGFFAWFDRLWDAVDARNDTQHYREGLFVWDVPTFDESVIREAVLNAIAHRDYRLHGSVFVRQYPRRLEVVSPGGLPPGITIENILWRQSPRNRRVCEAFQRCGLVERSGQGMNLIYEQSIRHGNPLPEFTGTDDYQVAVSILGVVEDPRFLAFLEKVGQERLAAFSTEHFLVIDLVHREQSVPDPLQPALQYLLDQGIIERPSRRRLILSRRLYAFLGKKGEYTRKAGLDRETNKMLLLKHITENQSVGSPIRELLDVLPSLTREQVKTLVRSLRDGGQIVVRGRHRGARWYPANPTSTSAAENHK